MSHTPEQQLLHDRIEKHIESGGELERAIGNPVSQETV